jgi:hypothetical protein
MFTPTRSYAVVPSSEPHYGGVPDGARIWAEIESHHAARLLPAAEPELVESLAMSFERLGDPTDTLGS